LIEIKNIFYEYPGNPVLKDITMSLPNGQLTAILGPNGAGKSTLIKLIAGILPLQKGELTLSGKTLMSFDKKDLAQKIAYVPQEVHLSFQFTVEEIVRMGRHPYQPVWAFDLEDDDRICKKALEMVEGLHLQGRIFNELSGGEKQLVLLASGIAQQPDIILLDEPAAALDIYHQLQIYQILNSLAENKNLTIIVITHQINLALNHANRIIILHRGMVEMDDKPETVLESDVFTRVFNVLGTSIYQEKKKKWYFMVQDLAKKK